jgi:nitroreductase
MMKTADNKYQLNPLIRKRWSTRAFDVRPVESGEICSLLEAARWAPSSYNEQPWRFFVGSRDLTPHALTLLQDLLLPGNSWAKNAPVLILTVAKPDFSHNGEPNRHWQHDVGLATENIVLQAEALGLVTHQMAGFQVQKAIDTLMIPPGYEPMSIIAVGYPGDPESLPEELKTRERAPRSRRMLQEMVFSDQWGATYPVCFT